MHTPFLKSPTIMSSSPSFSITNGVLVPAKQIVSPNFNTRPNCQISAIIIHNISLPPNQFGKTDQYGNHYVSAFFTNQLNKDDHAYFTSIHTMTVSAHLFIERDGKVTQFVNFNDRAWHAGQSAYLGRQNVNDFSIGIELEGTDTSNFTDMQYDTLSQIIIAIYKAYPHTINHLAGHSDIAPKRKTDPGIFDWQDLRRRVNRLNAKESLQNLLPELF